MRRILVIAIAAAALLAAVALAGVGRPQAARGDTAPQNVVTTIGHGVVTEIPDRATVSAGVRTTAASAVEALSHNAQELDKVVAALKRPGGGERQTQQGSVFP